MDKIDPQKAARVWQRVQNNTGIDPRLLQEQLAEEAITGNSWQLLSRKAQGQDREALVLLYRQAKERCSCLRGICQLLTDKKPLQQPLPPPQESAQALLRAGYGRLMHCLVRYEAWQTDPEYGPVFVQLAAQTRAHCRTVLQLIGSMK